MPRGTAFLLLGLLAAAPAELTWARQTARCNAWNATSVFVQVADEAASQALGTILIRPTDWELSHALWNPLRATRHFHTGLLGHYVVFEYPPEQDVWEIALAMRIDPLLLSRGLRTASINGGGCAGVWIPPSPGNIALVEYHHAARDHYALATSPEEAYAFESGAAGPGWAPSGQVLYTAGRTFCNGMGPVYRFQAPFPGGSVLTPDPDECGGLRREASGWRYDRIAFGAGQPVEGRCGPMAPRPVHRFYNQARDGSPNHRYVIDPNVRQQMAGGGGWIEEGVALCLPPQP